MSLAVSLLLAAAAAAPAPAETGEGRAGGVQIATARVAAQIVRPAVLRDGAIALADSEDAPRPQTLQREGRVTYEYE
jgi:hypothetical protein